MDRDTRRSVSDCFISVPAGLITIVVMHLSLPPNYPFHGLPSSSYQVLKWREKLSKEQIGRIDVPGTIALVSATVFLVAALEEANSQYTWGSTFVVISLVVSCISWAAFFTWSWWTTGSAALREPVFPWRFIQSRVCIGLFGYLNSSVGNISGF